MTGREIRAAVAYWRTILGLEDWLVTVKIGPIKDGHYGWADINIPYKKAELRFYPKGMQDAGEGIDEMTTHELCHRWTEEPFAYLLTLAKTPEEKARVEDWEEYFATTMARLALRLHQRPRGDHR